MFRITKNIEVNGEVDQVEIRRMVDNSNARGGCEACGK